MIGIMDSNFGKRSVEKDKKQSVTAALRKELGEGKLDKIVERLVGHLAGEVNLKNPSLHLEALRFFASYFDGLPRKRVELEINKKFEIKYIANGRERGSVGMNGSTPVVVANGEALIKCEGTGDDANKGC